MKTFTILFFISTLWNITSSVEINGLDTNVFEQVKENVNAQGSKEEAFINIIWPELKKFFPETAKIPGIELNFKVTEDKPPKGAGEYWKINYMCAGESKLYPKLSDVTSLKVQSDTIKDSRVVVEVDAKIRMDDKTMDFNLNKKVGGSNEALNTVDVKLSLKKENEVKFVLDIPDFSTPISDAKCLVKVASVDVTKLNEHEFLNSDLSLDEKNRVSDYWELVTMRSHIIVNMMSVALKKALTSELSDKGDYWICPTQELTNKVNEDKKEYVYSQQFKAFCKNGEIAD